MSQSLSTTLGLLPAPGFPPSGLPGGGAMDKESSCRDRILARNQGRAWTKIRLIKTIRLATILARKFHVPKEFLRP